MPFWKKMFNKKTSGLLPPRHRAGQTGGNGDHSQRLGENLHSEQLGRSSRTGRHRRRDAHPYVTRQERTHQGAGLLPLRAGHHGRERRQGI